MATLFQITLYAADEVTAIKAKDAAFRAAAELDRRLSDYQPNSELMQLCAKAGQGPVPVSATLFDVLKRAQEIAAKTDGAFDVTVGPVVRLWRLARRTRALPAVDELRAARVLVGYRMLKLDDAAKTATLEKPGMRLDLGGIAKGYAAQEMVKVLRAADCPSCLVAAGGDIVAGDPPPGETAWKVAIAPLANEVAPHVELVRAAVSTSGDAEQYVEIDGKRYAHIVDPKTGIGLTERFAVTVIADDGATADALATALAVMGADRGLVSLISWKGTAGRFVRQAECGIEVRTSATFPAMR